MLKDSIDEYIDIQLTETEKYIKMTSQKIKKASKDELCPESKDIFKFLKQLCDNNIN